MAVDDSNTKILLHFDGANGSTTIVDESGKTWAVTGSYALSTTTPKFGTAALLATSGSSGNYISTPDSADFNIGTGPFTIDCWVKKSTWGSTDAICWHKNSQNGTNQGYFLYFTSTGYLAFNYNGVDIISRAHGITDTTTWHHYEVSRDSSSNWRIFVDGVRVGDVVNDAINITSHAWNFCVAGDPDQSTGLQGSMDEFRFSLGIARNTINFTPSAAAYSGVPVFYASLDLNSIISFQANIMKGQIGDIVSSLVIPLSMGGTIQTIDFHEGISNIEFPPFTLSATGAIGCFGVANISFPSFDLTSTGIVSALGVGALNFPAFDISATGIVTVLGTASIIQKSFTLSVSGWVAATGIANISFPVFTLEAGNIVIGSIGTFDKEFPAFTLSTTTLLSINGSATILFPAFSLDTATTPLTATYLSMVLNLKNRALTLYDNYDFNSMCRFNGKHFGATSTNIYDLGLGDTDAGTLISWNLRTGYLDLEQKLKKKLRQAWLSYKSEVNIILTIIQPDGQEFEYTLDGIYDDETGLRIKFGKGIRSKYISLDIQNVDGSTLTLDSIKLILDQYTGKR
jgi:hypothetical protein